MKKADCLALGAVAAAILPFLVSEQLYDLYVTFNAQHGMIMSFLKFALLATFGEALGLRIRTGQYNHPGFGLLARAVVWGVLGLTIKLAFVVFASGVPAFLAYMGMDDATTALKSSFGWHKLVVALSISTAMNLIFAPVMMTLHKITDSHILAHRGSLACLLRPIEFGKILAQLNWDVQWQFVFKKTIPFFWIPAHTITFMLPADFQILFAALLGVALGGVLASANQMGMLPARQ